MIDKIKEFLKYALEDDNDKFPVEALNFWSDNYGARVEKKILDQNGEEWRIDHILTVDDREDVDPEPISWRTKSCPEALDYSVPYLESSMPNWEGHDKLIPIAGLYSSELSDYDLLVLNFMDSHDPKVSVWIHEESMGYEHPCLVDVAADFQGFLAKWNAAS